MSIAIVSEAASTPGTTSVSVADPSASAGQLLLVGIGSKYPPNSPVTPTGWTLQAQASGGAGSSGAGSGQVYVTVYSRVVTGGETWPLSISIPSGNAFLAFRMLLSKGASETWSLAAVGGSQNTPGTTWTVALASDPGFQPGDWAIAFSCINQDRNGSNSEAVSAAGVSAWGAQGERYDVGTSTGDDLTFVVSAHSVTTGTSTGNPTFTMAETGSDANGPAGATVLVRVRAAQPARVTQLVLEVVSPVAVALLNVPWLVQVDWANRTADAEMPWDATADPLINFLTNYSSGGTEIACLRGVDFTRRAFHPWRPSIAADTCTVRFKDTTGAMWPGKTTSLLYPNVERDRPARVLAQYAGVWYPQFYGTLREIVPPTQFGQAEGSVVIESPLRALASLAVTPTAMSSPTVLDALADLLTVAGLAAANIDQDDTGITASWAGAWGGSETTFGAALRELILAGDLVVSCEPFLRLATAEPDYQLTIWHTSKYLAAASSPYVTWIATDGDLNGPQDVTYHGPEPTPLGAVVV